MKTPHLILAASLCISAAAARAAGPTIPQRQPQEAYQKMTEDWPFALATPPVEVAAPVIGWASNYYVSGIGKNYANGKEEVFVAVKSKDQTASFSLYGNEPGFDGISIGGIEWSDKILESRVTLKKGSEFGTIKFDENVQQATAQQNMVQPRPGMPNLPGVKQQPMIRPAGVAVPRPTNIPQPVQQGIQAVPMPGGPSNTNAGPSNTNAAQNPLANPKQRVRVIKSTP